MFSCSHTRAQAYQSEHTHGLSLQTAHPARKELCDKFLSNSRVNLKLNGCPNLTFGTRLWCRLELHRGNFSKRLCQIWTCSLKSVWTKFVVTGMGFGYTDSADNTWKLCWLLLRRNPKPNTKWNHNPNKNNKKYKLKLNPTCGIKLQLP